MGDWDEGERPRTDFCDELDIGDIVAVKNGTLPIALVEVIGKKEISSAPNEDLDWFPLRRKIRILDFYKEDYNFSIPQPRGTFSKCADLNTETSKVIISWFKRIEKDKTMNDLIDLLTSNHQVILTGAPGTGKTYLAKQIAAKMLGCRDNELTKNQRFGFVQFHPAYDYTDFVEGLKPVKPEKGGDSSIGFALLPGIFMQFCKKAETQNGDCVFVIDEINRADLSRVFGELFYALEPEYRGEKGAVLTQYSSLKEEKDKRFHVPQNVYIIGTMNDIDRSVESIDFALRRRFAWYEVKAYEARFDAVIQNNLDESIRDEAKRRYFSLNEAIKKAEELGESYQIGPAYYLKVKEYATDNARWEIFWKRHLELLINEYLRGLPKPKKNEEIQKFRDAYDLKPDAPKQG